ncbi:unnamed protein product [Cylindrotheca closterium]|uniref:F-box domain-containing protein n=1 Tax=Cylindrotheca closterium TaxID=2856 RepID=A0AAD2G0R8_9STRA|nr:unnamed protein product [Cylindrotheca closterium]
MVVQTRRKRKHVSYYESDSDDDTAAMEEPDHAMEVIQAKWRGKAGSKKAKHPTKAPFEMVPDELLPQILSYLDNVRQLYHLSNMNKSLRYAISSELVIRAAVFSGNPYTGTLDGLMCELSNRKIRVPSTLRMLRLLNAKACERGKQCFCYNLEKEESGPLPHVTRSFGLAICHPCIQALSSCWGTDCPYPLQSTKLCTHGWSRVLCYPQVEQATGDAVGPIILFRDIKQIQYSYSDNTKREAVLASTIQSATAQAIGPDDEKRLQQFCDSHKEAKSQYQDYLEAKKRMKREMEEAIFAKRAARKLELARPVFQKLQSHFSGFQFESIVLNRDWVVSTGACEFDYWPSNFAFRPLVTAPSTATQRKITAAAATAKDIYTQLEQYGFLGDSFPRRLHQWLNTQENIPLHKQALVRYFAEHKTSELMIRSGRRLYEDQAVRLALAAGDRAKMVLERLSAQDCREAFAHAVERANTVPRSSRSSRQKRFQLAKHIWTRNNTGGYTGRDFLRGFSEVERFGEQFDECKIEYSILLRKILRYKKHPDTRAWIEDFRSSGNFSEALLPRDAIDTLYEGDFGPSRSSGTFEEWRRYQTSLVRTAYLKSLY